MKIWKRDFTLDDLNSFCKDTMIDHLGITFTSFGDDYMNAEMNVDKRTCQPYGMLHGGASVALAETVGSIAGNMCCNEDKCCLGLDINANHIKAAFSGKVIAKATPIYLGVSTQVWQIMISNENANLICTSRLTLAVRRRKDRINR